MQLQKKDIETIEVFNWKGIHLLHFNGSTCSKKIRIFLEYKGIDWVSHHINLIKRENNTDWFMGINPRGLVPVLVHNGVVHIESNDILSYLENCFPSPVLIPESSTDELSNLFEIEDKLHVDLRNLTMRYTAPSKLMLRTPTQLQQYQNAGKGTVAGQIDSHKAEELEYWQTFANNHGITDEQVISSSHRFRTELKKLDNHLKTSEFLIGQQITLADISWFVTINRLILTGYPLQTLHPFLWAWLQRLLTIPAFKKEAKAPLLQRLVAKVKFIRDSFKGKTIKQLLLV